MSREFSLWQIVSLFLWLLALLVHKVSGAALEFLEGWYLSSFPEEEAVPSEHPEDDAPVHSGGSEASSSSPGCRSAELIPSLPNALVQDHVWPLLTDCPSVTLLIFLRSVSSSWRQFLETSVEWNALRFLYMDTPGYIRVASTSGQATETVADRLLRELNNYRYLLAESMEEMKDRLRYIRLRREGYPIYVATSGCPPDINDCPEYYGL